MILVNAIAELAWPSNSSDTAVVSLLSLAYGKQYEKLSFRRDRA